MALPITIVSETGWKNFNPPFISAAGNVYVVAKQSTSLDVMVYKATDPTSSFVAQTTGSPNNTAWYVAVVEDNDVLHIATYDTDEPIHIEYHSFDMSDDTGLVTDAA